MKNRSLLVIGASSDLGIHLIQRIANNYDFILVHYNSSNERINELQKKYGEKIIPISADLSNIESVRTMIEEIDIGKYPDHIVHLAASKLQIQKFQKVTLNKFVEDYYVSVASVVQLLKAFLPHMAENKYGKIIFMLSSNVIGAPAKFQSSYTVAKYALLGLLKSLSVEYAEKGICINGISPEMIETRFLSDVSDLIVAGYAESSPMKRNLIVDDVLPTIEFLLSTGSDTVTGINIPITGGRQ